MGLQRRPDGMIWRIVGSENVMLWMGEYLDSETRLFERVSPPTSSYSHGRTITSKAAGAWSWRNWIRTGRWRARPPGARNDAGDLQRYGEIAI